VDDNRAFAEKFAFPFRLLSDPERKVGLAYGACKSAEDKYAARYTYVIGPDGVIEQAIDTKDPAGQAQALLQSL
jgi:thioredoxin-dependent peroxiredoxin